MDDLQAFWTFGEASGGRVSQGGDQAYTLEVGGGTVARVAGGPFSGYAADFTNSWLTLANASLGGLNIAGPDAQVTVAAWVKRDSMSVGFLGGIWQEDNNDPRRQYGLFLDLPTYGGDDNVNGHVSFSGGPTPGYPFSRDYSANKTRVFQDEWYMVAFTYDGEYARSYLDAKFEGRPTFTDNQGQTYAKNPYYFPDGLGDNGGDFTVGAVQLTSGMGNYYNGQIGGLAVFDRALTPEEIFLLQVAGLQVGQAASRFEFRHTASGNSAPSLVAWQAFRNATTNNTETTSGWLIGSGNGVGGTKGYLAKTTTGEVGIAWTDSVPAISTDFLDEIQFTMNNSSAADGVRLALMIEGSWFVTEEIFRNADSNGTLSNWDTEAELMRLDWNMGPGYWRNLLFDEGAILSLGELLTGDLPTGFLQGAGFYNEANTATLRLDNLEFFVDIATIPEPSAAGLLVAAWVGSSLLRRRQARR